MSIRVALAASGSNHAKSAELFAFGYCLKNMIDELLIIHVVDNSLAHYGDVDQRASGSCKAEFVDYINEVGEETVQILHKRLEKNAKEFGVSLRWLTVTGKVVEQIKKNVLENNVSTLIIGTGETPETFFAPRKNTALRLSRKIENCRIFPVSPG